jgi:hypothetical protein
VSCAASGPCARASFRKHLLQPAQREAHLLRQDGSHALCGNDDVRPQQISREVIVVAARIFIIGVVVNRLPVRIVGLPLAQRDELEAIRVIPDLVPAADVFDDFTALTASLPEIVAGTR